MTRSCFIILILIFLSCTSTGSNNATILIPDSETKIIVLTETKLGDLELDKLKENNIRAEVISAFPDFQVTKIVGHQDGPDFNLYQITHFGQEIFFISMDSYDTTLVQDLWTKNEAIKDVYGITVGQKIESVLEKRPNLNFHSDLHYNIYASEKNSKLEYRLEGNFKPINDTTFVSKEYRVEKWQVKGMTVDYLIWRK